MIFLRGLRIDCLILLLLFKHSGVTAYLFVI